MSIVTVREWKIVDPTNEFNNPINVKENQFDSSSTDLHFNGISANIDYTRLKRLYEVLGERLEIIKAERSKPLED